jgi:putative FmdB family regulatory protein
MPIYEYACRDCGEHVEVVQSFRDDPLTTCGLCGGSLRKVFSAAGIIFKGSGYYVTDSRQKPPDAPSESKPDTKKAAKPGDGSSKPAGGSTGGGSTGGEAKAESA